MIFVCAQPATLLYSWQVEVMLESFIKYGIEQRNVHIVCLKGNDFYSGWENLVEKYGEVNFSFYEDTRKTKYYVSSIRPNILKQHFEKNPHLQKETIFYHDCDIILTKKIDWEIFENGDEWYGSDCCDYLGYWCILSKGEDVLNKMCEVMRMDRNVVMDNQNNSIGAQCVMKGIDSNFWENIERDSEDLYKEITELNTQKIGDNPEYSPLVIYCSDMWALLWNAWKINQKTICHKSLEFCWAPRGVDSYERYSIFHNAGIQHDMRNDYFYKYNYIHKLPYGDEISIKENTASYKYWEFIKEVGKNTVLF
jgi:hypothetical protein